MLQLHVSDSLDDLSALLADSLRGAKKSLFDATTIVIPNAVVRTFVQLDLARRLGIAANIDFHFLNRFFATLIPEEDREKNPVLERDVLQSHILSLLADEKLLAKPELGPVRDYLHAAGTERDTVDLRRVQLAAKLARIFDDYTLTRPELLEAWKKGTTLDEKDTQSSTERWERALWLAVPWPPLPVLLDRYDVKKLAAPAELHVFGFTHFAPVFMKQLLRLAERSTIHVYTFAPCEETDRGLARFAAPSSEHLALWKKLGVEPKTRKVAPLAAKTTKVLACPSVAREVEVVASEIWKLVKASEEKRERLRFIEIALLLPARMQDAYRSQIAATLPKAFEIPVSSAAIFRAQESRVLEAVRLLLELPLGTFKRAELLRLMTHPNVLALVPDVEPEQWLEWCEELEILCGADRADLAATYVKRDLHNWDQGLKRLALGAFVSGERSRDESAVAVGGDDYLPLDHAQDELSSAASFALLARSLLADALAARRSEQTLTSWAEFFQRLAGSYLAATEDDEERLIGIASSRLRRLEELDLDDRKVSYRVAYELALAGLESLGETRGHDLAGGVVVAPLLPGRPIPFKATFVLGLGEGGFPASNRRDLLDLRGGEHAPGDVNPEERDRLTFLEVVAATQQQLTLSYVARDATTGEELAPCSLVREVEATFAKNVEHEKQALRRYDRSYFTKPLGEARETARSVPESLREAQVRALKESRNGPASDEPPGALHDLLGVTPPYETTGRAPDVVRVSIHDLCDFLMSPLQGWAQHALRLARDDDDGDVLLREDEVFEPTKLTRTVFLREVIFDALRRKGALDASIEAAHEEHAKRGELSGDLPTGVFLEVTRRAHSKILEKWHENLAALLDAKELAGLEPHRFGASDDFGESDVLHGPVVFDLEKPGRPEGAPRCSTVRVELTGRTNRILADGSGSVVLVASEEAGDKHVLRGFLDHALLAAARRAEPKTFRVFAIPAAHGAAYESKHTFKAFTPDEARAWLGLLLEEYLGGPHDYLLAFEPALEYLRDGETENPLVDRIRWLRDKAYKKLPSDAWGPIRSWKSYEPPEDAEAIAVRRLSPFVARLRGDE